MLSYRLGTVNDFHWKFKPVLTYSKPQKPQRQCNDLGYIDNSDIKP